MFDKLDDLLIRFEEVLNELGEPDVTSNPDRFQKLMKEQSDLQPIVDTYKEYLDKVFDIIQPEVLLLEEDLSGCNGPMISPDIFNEFVGDYYRHHF